MTKRWILNFLFTALGAFVLLLTFNLVGYGPALVKHESVRVILPPSRQAQTAQLVRRYTAPKPQVTAPAPAQRAIQPSLAQVPTYHEGVICYQFWGCTHFWVDQPLPVPTVAPVPSTSPTSSSCSEADDYYCAPLLQ